MKNNTKFDHSVILIKKYLLGFFLMLAISPISNADESLALFEPMDVFDLEWATDPRVSPDGKTIVYVRKSNDVMKDRERSNLWQISVDGNDHRPLYSGLKSIKSPRWSPNGKKLAFVSNDTGSQQIHVRWIDNGETAIGNGFKLPLVISTFTKLIALLKSKELNKIIINNTFFIFFISS